MNKDVLQGQSIIRYEEGQLIQTTDSYLYIAPSEAKNPTTSSSICVGLQITVANSVPFTLRSTHSNNR
jgi:hypothetical protein